MTEENLRPEVVDLGKKLALHMVDESDLAHEILSFTFTSKESMFLEDCMVRRLIKPLPKEMYR